MPLASGAMLGPSTTPTVVTQTTSESCRARRSGSAKSIAAYRACRLAALDPPKNNVPSSSSGTESTNAATTTSAAPTSPTRYANARPGRRPCDRMMRVAGIATSAAPTTAQLPASPDTVGPAMSAASSAPTEIPVATPMPPMICVLESSVSVRRCTRRTSTVVGEGRMAVTSSSFSGAEHLRH
jgi:hypothetical protein